MAFPETDDLRQLRRCVDLAAQALDAGDEPFGSVLVDASGRVLFEDRNRTGGGDATRHPELTIALWAAANLTPDERATVTVYTSGEHCAMCSAAHAWVGLGDIVYAVSGAQLAQWKHEWGVEVGPVAPLSVRDVAPGVVTRGPVDEFTAEMQALHRRNASVPPSE